MTTELRGLKVAKLTISRGATVNLGKYESARLDITVETQTNGEGLDYSLEQLDTWLIKSMQDRIAKIEREANLPPQEVARFTG